MFLVALVAVLVGGGGIREGSEDVPAKAFCGTRDGNIQSRNEYRAVHRRINEIA